MKIAGIDFPDSCPSDCKFKGDLGRFGQNSVCIRCPIFSCCGEDSLIRGESYRKDWAIEWKKFFDGEIDFPILKFR